jgi:hypothetical protein
MYVSKKPSLGQASLPICRDLSLLVITFSSLRTAAELYSDRLPGPTTYSQTLDKKQHCLQKRALTGLYHPLKMTTFQGTSSLLCPVPPSLGSLSQWDSAPLRLLPATQAAPWPAEQLPPGRRQLFSWDVLLRASVLGREAGFQGSCWLSCHTCSKPSFSGPGRLPAATTLGPSFLQEAYRKGKEGTGPGDKEAS